MKKMLSWVFILGLLLPAAAVGQSGRQVVFEGRIGDYAPRAGVYEINGTMYPLSSRVVVNDAAGRMLNVSRLRGGMDVKVHAVEVKRPYEKPHLVIQKIVILNR